MMQMPGNEEGELFGKLFKELGVDPPPRRKSNSKFDSGALPDLPAFKQEVLEDVQNLLDDYTANTLSQRGLVSSQSQELPPREAIPVEVATLGKLFKTERILNLGGSIALFVGVFLAWFMLNLFICFFITFQDQIILYTIYAWVLMVLTGIHLLCLRISFSMGNPKLVYKLIMLVWSIATAMGLVAVGALDVNAVEIGFSGDWNLDSLVAFIWITLTGIPLSAYVYNIANKRVILIG